MDQGKNPAFAEPTDKCPVCFGKRLQADYSLSFQGERLNWQRCHTCGFTFMNPRLLPHRMYRVYEAPEYWQSAYGNYFDGEPVRIENGTLRLKMCAAHMPRGGRLLDLACATGFFAAIAAERGFEVVGVDLNAEMIAFGRERYGLDLRVSRIEDCCFPLASFDVVSMWGLDCHFFDVRAVFTQIVGWLRPGGCILFHYQDYAHWIRRVFPKIKQEPNAYYNFTRDSFARLMRQLGMWIVMQRAGVQAIEVRRIAAALKLGVDLGALGDMKLKIRAPSYLTVVARKE
jgi:SAM-dependent methyltransferase